MFGQKSTKKIFFFIVLHFVLSTHWETLYTTLEAQNLLDQPSIENSKKVGLEFLIFTCGFEIFFLPLWLCRNNQFEIEDAQCITNILFKKLIANTNNFSELSWSHVYMSKSGASRWAEKAQSC